MFYVYEYDSVELGTTLDYTSNYKLARQGSIIQEFRTEQEAKDFISAIYDDKHWYKVTTKGFNPTTGFLVTHISAIYTDVYHLPKHCTYERITEEEAKIIKGEVISLCN